MSSDGGVLTEVAGRRITAGDVVARLKIGGAWQGTLRRLVGDAIVAQAAQGEQVSVSDEELQQALDGFRARLGLYKADETQQAFQAQGLDVEDVERYLESEILRTKLAQKLISDEQVERFYAERPEAYEFARVSHIVVRDKGAAEEIALSAREEGEDFAQLARRHSMDQATRSGGGYRGLVTRMDTAGLPKDVADRIFSGKAGEIIGPFETRDGAYCIVRVEETGRVPLDLLKGEIRGVLFQQWLAGKASG